jgi:transitional endoplasmic reticulum ATPase
MSEEDDRAAPDADPIDRIARVYLLRLYREALAAGRTLRAWLHDRGPLAFALGLTEQEIARWGAERLAAAVARALAQPGHAAPAGPLATAVRVFGRELGLDEAESEVLLLAVAAAQSDALATLSPKQLAGRCRGVTSMIAVAIGVDPRAAREALTPNSRLVRTGLLRSPPLLADDLSDQLQLLHGLAEALLEGRAESLFQDKLARAPAPAIALADAPYVRDEARTAIALLKGAMEAGARGVQVLLHGEPGVGKTELARLVAQETGASAFNVPDANDAGEPLAAEQRLRQFALMQRLLSRSRRAIVIFDEVEELLASPDPWGEGAKPAARLKAWKNRMLEETEVPSIWIGNSLHDIDPALLRRFTLAIRVPAPTAQARKAMLDQKASEYLVDAHVRALVAERDDITPADIARARRATELARSSLQEPAGDYFLRSLGMRADRPAARLRIRVPAPALPYRIDWLNTTPPVADIVRLLEARGGARLCFHGPPGTGKTALAQHLARALDRPLHAKKASDLLSAWLGETEQNLARAFEAAERDGAVLLLDEADSFLHGREHATRSWEVSQVNQLLKELEAFDGVVALCTNSFHTLDPAVLRRLDLKVGFGRLLAPAAREAFLLAAESLGLPAAHADTVLAAQPIPGEEVSLGDMAVAIRQARLRAATPSAALLRECVEGELRVRLGREGRSIGFLA